MTSLYERHLDQAPDQAVVAVQRAAEDWGGRWEGRESRGILSLPITHGLRQSLVEGPLSVEAVPGETGSILRFQIENRSTRLNWAACLVLLLGALGGIVAMLWPFFPNLLHLAPAGIVLAIAAWLLVASRLRTADVVDFLQLVAEDRPD
jgi:hypothetical protein